MTRESERRLTGWSRPRIRRVAGPVGSRRTDRLPAGRSTRGRDWEPSPPTLGPSGPCDEGLRRTECGVLSRARTPRPGGTVRAVVPLPLARPLLLRPPGWPRLSDRARLWEGPPARVRARPASQEAAARREVDPRR